MHICTCTQRDSRTLWGGDATLGQLLRQRRFIAEDLYKFGVHVSLHYLGVRAAKKCGNVVR